MTQTYSTIIDFIIKNYLIVFLIEVIIFYSIAIKLHKIRKSIKYKQFILDELSSDIPELVKSVRRWLELFNIEFDKKFKVSPLSSQEIGFLAGNIFTEIIKLKFNPLPKTKIFILAGIFFKLWKYKDKIVATIATKKLISL